MTPDRRACYGFDESKPLHTMKIEVQIYEKEAF